MNKLVRFGSYAFTLICVILAVVFILVYPKMSQKEDTAVEKEGEEVIASLDDESSVTSVIDIRKPDASDDKDEDSDKIAISGDTDDQDEGISDDDNKEESDDESNSSQDSDDENGSAGNSDDNSDSNSGSDDNSDSNGGSEDNSSAEPVEDDPVVSE